MFDDVNASIEGNVIKESRKDRPVRNKVVKEIGENIEKEEKRLYHRMLRKIIDPGRHLSFINGDFVYADPAIMQKYGRSVELIGARKPELRRDSVTGLAPKIVVMEDLVIKETIELPPNKVVSQEVEDGGRKFGKLSRR